MTRGVSRPFRRLCLGPSVARARREGVAGETGGLDLWLVPLDVPGVRVYSTYMTTSLHGQTIRYTTGPLGVLDSDGAVEEGDLGRYLGPAPDDGWHFTEPAKHPGKLCPVTPEMIEAA